MALIKMIMKKIIFFFSGLILLHTLNKDEIEEVEEIPTIPEDESFLFFSRVIPSPILREDVQGSGLFQAKRGDRKHNGVDIRVNKGQEIFTPIEGYVDRESIPYQNDQRWKGLKIDGTGRHSAYSLKIWYFEPTNGIIDTFVQQGQVM